MNELRHIYNNEFGITCFDGYFDYLNDTQLNLPANLAAFATDPARYTLNGRKNTA